MGVGEVAGRLVGADGEEFDVEDFVLALLALGFVAEVDGRAVASRPPTRPSLPRLRPRHVRWTLSPVLPVLLAVLVAAAAADLVLRPGLSLGYRSLLWHPSGTLVLGLCAGAGWALLLLHECAHLAVARATGVPARIRLGTRLQFLVMQTDISGIELAPRRHRMTAYLAGIAVNLAVASAALLGAAATVGTAQRALLALALVALLPLPFQLMVFMRTDVYFVLQDLLGCRDLYGDGSAYARFAARRLLRYVVPRAGCPVDPSQRLPARERRAVRAYAPVLVLGTALCLAFVLTVTLPADLTLLGRAADGGWGAGRTAMERADAAVVLVLLGGVHVLWGVTWWRGRRAG
jgi:hypothetical protein